MHTGTATLGYSALHAYFSPTGIANTLHTRAPYHRDGCGSTCTAVGSLTWLPPRTMKLLLLVALTCACACTSVGAIPAPNTRAAHVPSDPRVEALLAKMTLEEKAGQLGVFSRPGGSDYNPGSDSDWNKTVEYVNQDHLPTPRHAPYSATVD